MTVRDELQARVLFEQRYSTAAAAVAREIERRVIGGDWGANGYTTMAQADLPLEGLRGELARLEPPGAFAQRQADRWAMLAAIDAGLLCRALLLARRR
jgi:hypothetical protein